MSPSSFPAHGDHADTPNHPNRSSSGLTLVLPPLSALKAQKSKKKLKLTYEEPVKKTPRPLKLKPLKEVLSKLISQIKKKDDYAFFLHPVDLAQVPGYSDVVSRPMDLGTMSTKVDKGKYRSLEEFASDLRLVTTNAKTFNPPGTIYHTEADRIEAFALEHIAKAAATVIEYETDWNIEIEKDEDPVNVDDDDVGTPIDRTRGTPMDVDESRAGSPFPVQAGGKRVKGKRLPGPLSESIEADGGLPGAKDGLGAFPPCSDWAELMLALKLKGKRYKTKKERMRIEKGGPPLTAEGSLDYWEMEDPFTVFAPLVPDPLERPQLNPLYPSLEPSDLSLAPLPGPVNIIPVDDIPEPVTLAASHSAFKHPGRTKPAKRRHWTIVRNAPSRGRARDATEEEPAPAWSNAREPAAPDFGTFATLPSVLAEERRVRDMGAELGSEAKMFDALRQSCQPPVSGSSQSKSGDVKTESYWEGKAIEAEAYIRDVVYGGLDGFAYVRSLAEFLTPSEPIKRDGKPPTHVELGMPVAKWVEQHIVDPLTDDHHAVLCEAARILRELPPTPPPEPSSPVPHSIPMPTSSPSSDPIRHQLELSLRTYPAAARALQALQDIARAQIDLPALIHTPDELFRAEDVWAGREYREKRRREMDEALARDPEKNAAAYLQWAIEEHREAEAGAGAGAAAPGSAGAGVNSAMVEDAGMLAFALEYAADEIARLARGKQPSEDGGDVTPLAKADPDGDVEMKAEDDVAVGAPVPNGAPKGAENKDEPGGEGEEDPTLKKLRLNLLALAKRAPLDQIMKLPAELVPAHLRHIVPTADA
ncbi:Bromodomain-containing protein 9 [Trametes pubescens]|uniref:Bromodomain-containing protein 9 n=1 Tax=Trametes pubescens TaxID=154538 RepID=A0A1M2VNQ4_TRAPU|nr:Bromodomain-containing protein 9 [Trametes pubescens]